MTTASDSRALGKVPCTIVTGFLGSGKTTLIRHLLTESHGRRLAVVVNEFGEVGIDGEILAACGIEDCPAENIVELANGCLCCTVADDFVPALDAILSRTPRVDHIVIETSGLALPKPLVQAFRWPSVAGRVTVDGVIAVVDGAAVADGRVADDEAALAAQRAADGALDHDDPIEEVFEDQIACADLVILSKADLLDAAALERVRSRIAGSLPRAVSVVTAALGRLDPRVVLGLGAEAEAAIDGRRTHHDDEEDHDHDEFESFAVAIAAASAPAVLAERVARVAAAAGVLRVKGFAAVEGKPMRLVVQAVGPRVEHHFDRAWRPDEARDGRLVVIGLAGLDRPAIEAMLAA